MASSVVSPPRPSYSRTRGGRRVNIGVSTTSAAAKIRFSRSESAADARGAAAGARARAPPPGAPRPEARQAADPPRQPLAVAELGRLVADAAHEPRHHAVAERQVP